MKRLFILIVICVTLFAGCSGRSESPENTPQPTNNFGTQAINLPSSQAAESKIIEDDESTNSSSAENVDSKAADSVSDNGETMDSSDAPEKTDLEVPSSAPDSNAPESDENTEEIDKDTAVSSQVDADVEIKEKLFIAQINDIYLNAEDYIGKTIKYEGVFDYYTWEEENLTYYAVIRYCPGCCGNDGNAGFEVVWDGDYPNKNDWVEAVGTLEFYEENGWKYLRLALTSLTVLETRGAEYVSQ